MPAPLAQATLATATPPTWAVGVVPHLDELLIEQAHLEKKAAAAAVAFLFRLPMHAELHRELSALAREELVHFERTLRLLERRSIVFAAQASSGYAEQLKRGIRRDREGRLADELLVAGIIEARSHERMHLLSLALAVSEPEVAAFYGELCAAEARHEQLYRRIADLVAGPADLAQRQRDLADHEARVLAELTWSPRLHGGLAEARDDA